MCLLPWSGGRKGGLLLLFEDLRSDRVGKYMLLGYGWICAVILVCLNQCWSSVVLGWSLDSESFVCE